MNSPKNDNINSSLVVSPSPHFHGKSETSTIMLDVIIALIPAIGMSIYLFDMPTWGRFASIMIIIVCVAACVASEYLFNLIVKRPQTVGDFSAVVTGVLLALNLPANIPLWQAAFGGVVAIVVAKMMFGGLGQNFVNPALVGRIVLMASFSNMADVVYPFGQTAVDALSTATPINDLAQNGIQHTAYSIKDLLLGTHPGAIGEVCAVALIIGAIYLFVRKVISPLIPVCFVGTVFIVVLIARQSAYEALYHILSGGLLIGAIFMATDYTTTPLTTAGRAVFGIGCGLLTVLIRLNGSLPEGVAFSIVIMNILTPLIDRVFRPAPFGTKRFGKKEETENV